MRYVIYGAGAIGGTIAARLHSTDQDVLLIARGAHLAALQRDGLHFETPDGAERLQIPALASPREAKIGAEDVLLLAMKTQDTAAALLELRDHADAAAAIVCAQNGVENERLALRLFAHVYGMCVYLPAQHLEPGVVQAFAAPTFGVLDLGRAPDGVDERAQRIAADIAASGFACEARPDIMRWKYAKLISNVGNAVQALFGPGARGSDFDERARAETHACYAAAAIDFTPADETTARHSLMSPLRPVAGQPHTGGSSWQSLARQAGSIESDYLNGEIVLLGRLHGVPTPVNEALRQMAARMTRDGSPAGSADPAQFEALVTELSG
jgi:2-dehydropantoate 2-reductase